jgi:hypothetical protein
MQADILHMNAESLMLDTLLLIFFKGLTRRDAMLSQPSAGRVVVPTGRNRSYVITV